MKDMFHMGEKMHKHALTQSHMGHNLKVVACFNERI